MSDTPHTIPALVDHGARKFGDRPAVVDRDLRLSYRELAVEVRGAARAYMAIGVRPVTG